MSLLTYSPPSDGSCRCNGNRLMWERGEGNDDTTNYRAKKEKNCDLIE